MKAHRLSDSHLFSYSKAVYRLFLRLSKPSLLRLALLWADDPFCSVSKGSVRPARDASVYKEWLESGSVSRRDIVERIVSVDWVSLALFIRIYALYMRHICVVYAPLRALYAISRTLG